ncbi:unnamed protein product [Orchesella dallaii]|uniref:Uncharacterized protein n=1 Tax=Orchesella dallaii TaxID=48710 RepID=A0ABP1PKK0_9HEXA
MKAGAVDEPLQFVAMQNASQGIATRLDYFPKSRFKVNIALAEFAGNYFTEIAERKFSQFAVDCSQDCTEAWNAPLLQQNRLKRIIPKQSAFFNYFEFWRWDRSFYGTIHFPRFLSVFVEAGLYDLLRKRHKMFESLWSLKSNNYMQNLGISDGRLFSYVVFGRLTDDLSENVEEGPAKVSSFIGIFLLNFFIVCGSLLVFASELWRKKLDID